MTSGDAPNCDDDDPCDGVKTITNSEHTACGKSKEIFFLSQLSAEVKTIQINRTKTDVFGKN